MGSKSLLTVLTHRSGEAQNYGNHADIILEGSLRQKRGGMSNRSRTQFHRTT